MCHLEPSRNQQPPEGDSHSGGVAFVGTENKESSTAECAQGPYGRAAPTQEFRVVPLGASFALSLEIARGSPVVMEGEEPSAH